MSWEDVCADCGASAPTWASINRGVLICDECCSVHRSLGRHISYIRSLRANNWPPVLRETVTILVKKGANTVWEHALHDPHSKVKIKKPSPKDKLQPTKHDYIVQKYKHLMLLSKANNKDNPNLVQELSKQLHASVRTANLDTCLRILSLGADPNFLHPERGNTPLHVAAQAGQSMQVELLIVYGANPTILDRLGHTPEECARIAGHHQLADRLIECQYELTDKLSYFLCGRYPSHNTGEHYLIPRGSASNSVGLTEARTRLQELNNQLLEELAADVYDEVDRRESDAIWLTTQQISSSVAFLPVNPKFSPLRNQGRQKLGILETHDFSQLIIDILVDTKRRQASGGSRGDTTGTAVPSTSDEQEDDLHDYDEVPVENERDTTKRREHKYEVVQEEHISSQDYAEPREDGAPVPPSPSTRAPQESPPTPKATQWDSLPSEVIPHDPTSRPLPSIPPSESTSDPPSVSMLLERLKKVEAERDSLALANQILEQRMSDLQKQLNRMIEENAHLRTPVQTPTQESPPPVPILTAENSAHVYSTVEKPKRTQSISKSESKGSPTQGSNRGRSLPGDAAKSDCLLLDGSRTIDLVEVGKRQLSESNEGKLTDNSMPMSPAESQPHANTETAKPDGGATKVYEDGVTMLESGVTEVSGVTSKMPESAVPKVSESVAHKLSESVAHKVSEAATPKILEGVTHKIPEGGVWEDQKKKPQNVADGTMSQEAIDFAVADSASVIEPTQEELDVHIKMISQNIQELLAAAQSHKQASFGPSSVKIAKSIAQLSKCFSSRCSQTIQASLREMGLASQQLQKVCQDTSQADLAYHTRLIVNCCYDVAKAARHLVMCVQQERQ